MAPEVRGVVRRVRIGGRDVGHGCKVLIIAEAGVNHNGDAGLARELVAVAAAAGADAVKFQTFQAERLASPMAPKARYQLETTKADESQVEMLRGLQLSPDAYRDLRAECERRGVIFLSTPFDAESGDFLEALGVPAFKLGSGEVTNWPLLHHIGAKRRPVILSTGMANLGEVDDAVRVLREAGASDIVLLHCVSSYPADPDDTNLLAIPAMARAWGLPVGYSDHTPGTEVAVAAVALGACVIEKHFTVDRNLPGPDHRASLDPAGLEALVSEIRTVERALGDGIKRAVAAERENREIVRRSLAITAPLSAGTVLERSMLTALRPATGIAPAYLHVVLGRRLRRPLTAGSVLTWSDLE